MKPELQSFTSLGLMHLFPGLRGKKKYNCCLSQDTISQEMPILKKINYQLSLSQVSLDPLDAAEVL